MPPVDGEAGQGQFATWTTVPGARIIRPYYASCARWQWHAVAGWLNHRVAIIDVTHP
jgi:hypothetical protein